MEKMPQRIKATRKAMRLSQKELASLVGTDQAHISRIENGEITPSVEALTKIAHQLDMRGPTSTKQPASSPGVRTAPKPVVVAGANPSSTTS